MTATFLALLAIGSIAVIVPAAMRARRSAPLLETKRFQRGLHSIAPRGDEGRWILVPPTPESRAKAALRRRQRRRRRILAGLVSVAALTFIAAVWRGGALWELHVASDLAVAGYAALLLEAKRRRAENDVKVRSLERSERRPRHQEVLFRPARAGVARR